MEPMRAQARETLPSLAPGRVAVQPKFDGFRALLHTPLREGDPVLFQTRRGALVQDRFLGLAAAARSLPNGLGIRPHPRLWPPGPTTIVKRSAGRVVGLFRRGRGGGCAGPAGEYAECFGGG